MGEQLEWLQTVGPVLVGVWGIIKWFANDIKQDIKEVRDTANGAHKRIDNHLQAHD